VKIDRIQYNKLYKLSKPAERLSSVKLAVSKSLVGNITFIGKTSLGVDVYVKEPKEGSLFTLVLSA
jgi:hypothetical protein